MHEETDAPTQGYFEKAFINHGSPESHKGDSYEYLTTIGADEEDIMEYMEKLPYSVLKADSTAHIVRDHITDITGCSAFQKTKVDELIEYVTPSILLYKKNQDTIELSISNPDLALYQGCSDEILDENGKRKERSVYGRSWINNPSGEQTVEICIKGEWAVIDCTDNKVSSTIKEGKTTLTVYTRESKTEEISLRAL